MPSAASKHPTPMAVARIEFDLTVFSLGGIPTGGTFRLTLSPSDPCAVHIAAYTRSWVCDRGLLMAGRVGPAGPGELSFGPLTVDETRCVRVDLPGCEPVLLLKSELDAFLEATLASVPEGSEFQFSRLDDELRGLDE